MNAQKQPRPDASTNHLQPAVEVGSWDCPGCGNSVTGAKPERCKKCGGVFIKAAKPFLEIENSMQLIQQKLRSTAVLVSERQHRKSRFLIAQLRRADEALDVALSALNVSGRTDETVQTKGKS